MFNTRGSIQSCKIIELPVVEDPRGKLSFIENSINLPFDIKRVYFLYDISAGSNRGGHAHKKLMQYVLALSGSFEIVIDDGLENRRFTLNHPRKGLFISPMIWRNLENFSSGAVCLVLASEIYDENDYIRNYNEFLS